MLTVTRRDEIVAAATQLFAEKGYEGASMSDLAERVGLRKASLFHHFTSKEELREAVLERLITEIAVEVAAAAAADSAFPDRLDGLSDAIVQVLAHHQYAARVILREAMEWGPHEKGPTATGVQTVLAAGAEFVRAGQRAGAFRPGDARHIVMSLVGIHFMPFVIAGVVEGTGEPSPFSEAYVTARRAEVRAHVRALMVIPK